MEEPADDLIMSEADQREHKARRSDQHRSEGRENALGHCRLEILLLRLLNNASGQNDQWEKMNDDGGLKKWAAATAKKNAELATTRNEQMNE
uniref:Uncharacterized protein n=1 Tax=Globodera rostochiensis TaxID=31243 RepID=A0A914I509_GLORO